MALPVTTDEYRIDFSQGLDGLRMICDVPLPKLGPNDCFVQIEAVSLNYRDIAMPLGLYPAAKVNNVVPTSDGAGVILAVGTKVKDFKVGDKVCNTFFRDFENGFVSYEAKQSSLGGLNDGPLRKHAVFAESALVHAPPSLTSRENSTLTCAALTAWNALFGLEGRTLQPGQSVLTQGTGGVSLVSPSKFPTLIA